MSVWNLDSAGVATPAESTRSQMLPVNYCALADTTVTADQADSGEIKIANIASADADLYFNTSSTSLSVNVAFANEQTVSGIGLHHDLSYAGEVRARLYLAGVLVADITQDAHLPLYSWGDAPGWDMMDWEGYPLASDPESIRRPYMQMWFDTVIADSMVLDISDASAITINHLSLGLAWAPGVNHSWGSFVAPVKAAKVLQTTSGASLITPEPGKNEVGIQFEWLTDGEIQRLNNILLLLRQRGEPIYISLYPGRGGQREQQGMILIYPTSWTDPKYGKSGGIFSMKGIEINAYTG